MNREDIENIVSDILIEHGPDGHIDGYKEITDYIMTIIDPRIISKPMNKYTIKPLTIQEDYENSKKTKEVREESK